MPPKKFTLAQAEQALLNNYGNVLQAAREIGVSHPALYSAIKKHDRLRIARELAQEQAIDTAESSLLKAVRGGEAWAVCFLLKTIGKKRGFVERQEFATAPGNPFEVNILGAVLGQGVHAQPDATQGDQAAETPDDQPA